MVRLRPGLRRKLLEKANERKRRRDIDFPDYLSQARVVLPDGTSDPRFEFVVYQLWMMEDHYGAEGCEARLPSRYESFVRDFDWNVPEGPPYATDARVLEVLSFMQRRYPCQLRAEAAIRMLRALHLLASPSHA